MWHGSVKYFYSGYRLNLSIHTLKDRCAQAGLQLRALLLRLQVFQDEHHIASCKSEGKSRNRRVDAVMTHSCGFCCFSSLTSFIPV